MQEVSEERMSARVHAFRLSTGWGACARLTGVLGNQRKERRKARQNTRTQHTWPPPPHTLTPRASLQGCRHTSSARDPSAVRASQVCAHVRVRVLVCLTLACRIALKHTHRATASRWPPRYVFCPHEHCLLCNMRLIYFDFVILLYFALATH
jgi:hypothetical protein